ncbi:MAG: hypothetical protein AB7E32_14070 [Desulfovibrio sp.]
MRKPSREQLAPSERLCTWLSLVLGALVVAMLPAEPWVFATLGCAGALAVGLLAGLCWALDRDKLEEAEHDE